MGKAYIPLIIWLPLLTCACTKPAPVAPRPVVHSPLPQPPPADGIMFVPADQVETVKRRLLVR